MAAVTQKSPGFFARIKLLNPKQSVAKDANALRIGVLGAANIAPNALINPAKSMSSIIVVSIAARDENKAKSFATKHGIPNTHPSYDAIISDPNIDCIHNPLPNGLHYEWTKKALEAGKHVLLEKPSTSNTEQTRKHIASGHPLQRVKAVMSFPNAFPATDIRFNYSLGGGTMMDCGCYTINSIRYFTGFEIASVEKADPKIVAENIDGRMDAVLRLKRDDNTFAEAELNASLTNPWLSIQTYREIIPMFIAETDDKIFTFGVFLLPTFYHYLRVKDKATGKSENHPKVYGNGHSTYKYQLEAFVEAVKNGGKDVESIPGWVTGEDSVLNMVAIDAVYMKAGMKLRG
ncbi:hypothetical protein BGX26_010639 [Mortierella sp. AD094]|nr:hypothetical protein BGX26_010639 [Mortierella sp. AD094]